ncbi:hypothetical protein [Vibrio hangzhouensis]|uniref:Uncharacterized protein n=1 Tax=Vibrio hangzhouensis TaxID=462991 RepID=A0A1H5YBE2_9VIBR|nr:hypothetical protein [Vibrio hangzhouensis]SEG21351.1 hypothetical protein SAMN04488244_1092 [Vibrio hangzhouensis]
MQLDFKEGMTIPVTLSSEWVFIETSQGKVELQIESTGERVNLAQKSLYKSNSGLLGRVLITAIGVVELEHGIGDYTPPIEGQKLAVESMPPVDVAKMPAVQVASLPPVELAEGQQVIVTQLPAIQVAQGQQIGVSTLPDVVLAGGQQVGVASMPALTIADKQYVRIESMPVLKVAANQEIGIRRSNTLTTSEVSLFPHEIPANEARLKLLLKAPLMNTAAVMVGTFSLDAGEKLEIDSTASFTLTGQAGDKVQLMEW